MTSSNETEKSGGHCCGPGCCHGLWKVPFIFAAIVLIKSGLVLLLWNALIPGVFSGPALNYLQAVELTVLAKLLVGFGGFKHFGGWHGGWGSKRWAALSSEEREKLREEIRNRCC